MPERREDIRNLRENPVVFQVATHNRTDIVVLEFILRRPLIPSDLKRIRLPKLPEGKKILYISGRGPIWLYGYIIHHYVHQFQVVAVHDPKLAGGVVVASHTPEYEPGDAVEPVKFNPEQYKRSVEGI